VKVPLPIWRHTALWTGHRLVEWVIGRRGQRGTVGILVGRVVPEPVLSGLEALHDGMLAGVRVLAGVLRRGRIATADVAATRTPT